MIERGEVYWVDLGEPTGSGPAKRRPVLVVQSNPYNASRLATVVGVVLTSNTALAAMPGNLFLASAATGLTRDSVANVTAMVTVDKRNLDSKPVGRVPGWLMDEVDDGLRSVLGL